jgi:hypothetical protein
VFLWAVQTKKYTWAHRKYLIPAGQWQEGNGHPIASFWQSFPNRNRLSYLPEGIGSPLEKYACKILARSQAKMQIFTKTSLKF